MNVYAREAAAQASVVTMIPPPNDSSSAGSDSSASAVVRPPLKRNEYAPLAAWRDHLLYIDAEGREVAAAYNRVRVRVCPNSIRLAAIIDAWKTGL